MYSHSERKTLVIGNECIRFFFYSNIETTTRQKCWGFIRNVAHKTVKILKNKKIQIVQNSMKNAMGGVKSPTSAE